MHESASSIWENARRTRVWRDVDARLFHEEIAPLGRPALLKGVAAHWPAVSEAAQSPQALSQYILRFSTEQPVEAFFGAPAIKGRFAYSDDLKGFNFDKKTLPLSALFDLLTQNIDDANAPAFYAGAVNIPRYLPGLATENAMPLLSASVEQLVSLWIGNRTRTAAHWDLPQNIACIIAGRRRYTMFPTSEIENLYVGPLDVTPAGRAISLVDFHNPDFEAHPRFRDALQHAEIADLEPGDGLYVPSMWFHHVESFDAFGVMMNFWWRDGPPHLISPQLTMMHALLTMRDLPPNERAAWRTMFDHYIFQTGDDPMAHIPEAARGLFGEMTPEKLRALKDILLKSLSR
jgi:hypothetical protein